MPNQIKRSSTARIVSIIVIFGLIPTWFFYIGVKYKETMNILESNSESLQMTLYK
jgi:hypothetical protein